MEERVALLRKCIARDEQTGLRHTMSLYQKQLAALLPQLQQFREMLSQKSSVPFEPSPPVKKYAGGDCKKAGGFRRLF
jgi:hypothetical protein